jgi:hypothetical protein
MRKLLQVISPKGATLGWGIVAACQMQPGKAQLAENAAVPTKTGKSTF